MANILTTAQAGNALRLPTDDARMLDLLPQIDLFIQKATGRDWTQDSVKHAVAVAAATMLLVQWYENPAMVGNEGGLTYGLTAALAQLEAEALKYRKYQFYGLNGAGGIALEGALVGDDVISLVGVYGVSGSQAANFESEISVYRRIQQTSAADLSHNLYVVVLKSPKDDVVP